MKWAPIVLQPKLVSESSFSITRFIEFGCQFGELANLCQMGLFRLIASWHINSVSMFIIPL